MKSTLNTFGYFVDSSVIQYELFIRKYMANIFSLSSALRTIET